MKVNVLGTDYTVTVKQYGEDEAFERNSSAGWCDEYNKEIVICDMTTYRGWEHENAKTADTAQKNALRHEIVHAFFNESGLTSNGFSFDGAWPHNEEMVDWFALQGPKIYKAWEEAGAL